MSFRGEEEKHRRNVFRGAATMKTILVTGGTGTLGKTLVPMLFNSFDVDRVRVLSRDEHKQTQMDAILNDNRIDYFIGDVRDKDRVWYASKGCCGVFHLAAVKSVDKAEYNPNEAIDTNITGTRNVVDACIKHDIPRAIITSTDKAVEPLNVYGATKLVAEKLFIQSNSYSGKSGPMFGAVRYGNVLGSNGSVIQKWDRVIRSGGDPIMTDPTMTRYWISKEEAAKFVIQSYENMGRGQVRIPKMQSCFMAELYDAFCKATGFEKKYITLGLRPGEKMHERLIGAEEIGMVTDIGECWVKWPSKPMYPVVKHGAQVEDMLSSKDLVSLQINDLSAMIKAVL